MKEDFWNCLLFTYCVGKSAWPRWRSECSWWELTLSCPQCGSQINSGHQALENPRTDPEVGFLMGKFEIFRFIFWTCWFIPLISVPERQRQANFWEFKAKELGLPSKFQASHECIMRSCLKKKKSKFLAQSLVSRNETIIALLNLYIYIFPFHFSKNNTLFT